jgi:phage baseplate assembly protein W
MIRKGEKLMQPNFGSIIWNMLFEPLTEETKKVILDDVTAIVGYDPRIAVDSVIIQELGNGLQLQIALTYKPEDMSTTMTLAFDKNSQKLTMS